MGKPDGFVDTVYWTYKQVVKLLKNPVGGGASTWGSITGSLSNQSDLQNSLNDKEDSSNKSTDINADQASNSKYPSVKALFDWTSSVFTTTGDVASQISSALTSYATESWVNSQGFITSLVGYVPTSRNITVGATTYDLSADRIFAIPTPPGTVNVVRAVIGPAITTVNSTTPVDVMSVSITPSHANNIIVVIATIVYTHAYGSVSSFGIFKNGTATVSTSGNGNENNMQYTTYFNAFQASDMQSIPLMHTELAGTTSPITYSVAVTNGWGGTPANLYINGRVGDDMGGFSYLTVFEIKQ